MQKLLLSIGLFFLSLNLQAQIGISGSYLQATAADWEEYYLEQIPVRTDYFYRDGFQLGLNYWFRLKRLRIEFLPGVHYAQLSALLEYPQGTAESRFHTRLAGLGVNTNIYLFDLFDDCNCPTFSKQDPIFRKGFFIQLGVGADALLHQMQLEYLDPAAQTIDPNPIRRNSTDIAYRLSAGAGLDIGLSDLLTITPFVRYTYFLDAGWENFEDLLVLDTVAGEAVNASSLLWFEGGLHLSVRLDQ